MKALEKINIHNLTKTIREDWKNFVLAEVNDHVIRVSVLSRDFHWHSHPNSDETFLCLEGKLLIDLEDRTEFLKPGELFTIPKGIRHRTRAKERSVNLTFEHRDTDVMGGEGQ